MSELTQCMEIVHSIRALKDSSVFEQPVDPIEMQCPDYFEIVKRPMDLCTLEANLKGNKYANAFEFYNDLQLIFDNCIEYNDEEDNMYRNLAKDFKQICASKFSRIKPLYGRKIGKKQKSKNKFGSRRKLFGFMKSLKKVQFEAFLIKLKRLCPDALVKPKQQYQDFNVEVNYELYIDRIPEDLVSSLMQIEGPNYEKEPEKMEIEKAKSFDQLQDEKSKTLEDSAIKQPPSTEKIKIQQARPAKKEEMKLLEKMDTESSNLPSEASSSVKSGKTAPDLAGELRDR